MSVQPDINEPDLPGESSLAEGGEESHENLFKDLPKEERWGAHYYDLLTSRIVKNGGQFLRDEDGGLHVVLDGRRISLTLQPNNYDLKTFLYEVCRVSTLQRSVQVAIERLQVKANKCASGLRMRRFSALSENEKRLHIPNADGMLLQIGCEGTREVRNGSNDDQFWVEHPNGEPFSLIEVDPGVALPHFERLLVDTQACEIPEMRWLVAMHEGLFPFVRDLCPARLIVVHQGGTQQGKTTGAERFTLLHGLGKVQGDCSIASLANMGDIGLLVMDNKEQANLSQAYIDFLLFLATGVVAMCAPATFHRTARA